MLFSETTVGIVLLLLSLFCLGTWPALLRLASSSEVEEGIANGGSPQSTTNDAYSSLQAGEHSNTTANTISNGIPHIQIVCHAYLDYATAYFLASSVPFVIATLYLMFNDNMSLQELWQLPPLPLIAVAMLGGTLLSMGNLSFQWATAVFQASLTLVLAIQASMTILLGTGVNYWLEPTMTQRPVWLVAGIGCFLGAIGVAVQSQLLLEQSKTKGESIASTMLLLGEIEIPDHLQIMNDNKNQIETNPKAYDEAFDDEPNSHADIHDASRYPINSANVPDHGATSHSHKAAVNTQHNQLVSHSNKEHSKKNHIGTQHEIRQQEQQSSVVTALIVAFLGGLSFGFFSPCFNVAVNDPFHWTTATNTGTETHDDSVDDSMHETLRVTRANLIFSFAFWLASMVGNIWLLKQAQQRQPQEDTASSSSSSSVGALLQRYFYTGSFSDRKMALAAGLVCAMGNVLQFQGGQLVGYATADLVQAYPLVSTVWDVLWFGEFRTLHWPSRLASLLVSMYLAYITGVILFAGSSIGND